MEAAKSLPQANLRHTSQDRQELPDLIKRIRNYLSPSSQMPRSLVTTSSRSERYSIGEIEKLMEELRAARDYLRSEGERVRRMNAHYAHLTRTASASVKIIAESMGKWRTTEMEAATEAEPGMRRSHA